MMYATAIAYTGKSENGETPVFHGDGTLWFTISDAKKEKGEAQPVMSDEEWLRYLHHLADISEDQSLCYFIGGEIGCIKIGYSSNVPERLKAIQACSPIAVRLLAIVSGGGPRETAYHAQFDHLRSHGEWFHRDQAILDEIEKLSREAAPNV